MAKNKAHKSAPISGGRQAVIVLGMHRSGTSALTGVLDILGVTTPTNQIKAGEQNERGFFEAKQIARLNDDLLSLTDRTWEDWRPAPEADQEAIENGSFFKSAEGLIKTEFGDTPLFALKDPRICRLMPFWIEFLKTHEIEQLVLHTHRHPLEVAQSLQKRNELELSHGLLLWLTYVLQAEAETRGLRRAFTSFDHVIADPVQTLNNIQNALGLTFPHHPEDMEQEISDFVSVDLRHHTEPDTDTLPDMVGAVFEIMNRWAASQEDPRDHDALDRIRRVFFHVISEQNDPDILWQALAHNTPKGSSSEIERDAWPKPDLLQFTSALYRVNEALHQELEMEVTRASAKQSKLLAAIESRHRELGVLAQLLHQTEISAQEHEKNLKQTRQDLENTTEEKATALEQAEVLKSEMQSIEAKIQDTTKQNKIILAENNDLRQWAERADLDRQAIADSTFWRATAPLRKTLDLFRRKR